MENFQDFCETLLESGFSLGGATGAKGIYSAVPFGWEEQAIADCPIRWFIGDPDTDPWQWRMRILEERSDIAYAKLFFRTSGYIARDWYADFYAVRRAGDSFQDAWVSGTVTQAEKRIYDVLARGEFAYHELKALGGFRKEDHAAFERAILELQMRMFITASGFTQKINKYGEPYGWDITVFARVEDFWQSRGYTLPELDPEESYDRIREQIMKLNPNAQEKTICKFILGK